MRVVLSVFSHCALPYVHVNSIFTKTYFKFGTFSPFPSCSVTQTSFLMPNTESAWKFQKSAQPTGKNFGKRAFSLKQTSNSALFHRCHRVLSNKCHFWRRIRNRPENLPRNPFSIRLFNVVLRWHRFCQLSSDLKILGLNPIFSFFSVKQGFWARIRNQRQKSAEPSARVFLCTKILVSLEIHHLKMDSEVWIDSVSKFFRGGEAGFIQSVDCS